MLKKVGLFVQVAFYLVAGINHFWHPGFYAPLIPSYLPYHDAINVTAGIAEVLLALGLLSKATRTYAVYGLLIMLVLFIPSHVYFLQIGGCVADSLCVPLWVGWVRLVIIHPLLLWWAWAYR